MTKGSLIVNADDWGRDLETTGRTFECIRQGTVSAVSAMVFMADSQRAASIARDLGVDSGLHLNLTLGFDEPGLDHKLIEHHGKAATFLRRHRLAPAMFHPGLAKSFTYLVKRQIEEFARLYGSEPARIDGHHHMHLCANVLMGGLLPARTAVRRNFSFLPGEKSALNRWYRNVTDRLVARRHHLTDYFFSLPPMTPTSRIDRILSLANEHSVEVETHPINPEEYRFLMGPTFAGRVVAFPRSG